MLWIWSEYPVTIVIHRQDKIYRKDVREELPEKIETSITIYLLYKNITIFESNVKTFPWYESIPI